MEPTDVTIEILKGIRDGVHQTNVRVDETNARLHELRTETNARLDQTNARLDELRSELSRRIVESEVRTATAISDLACSVREMTGVLRAQHDLRPRVEQCERDIVELRKAVGE